MAWYDDIIRRFTSSAEADRAVRALEDYRTLRPVINRLVRIGLEAKDALDADGDTMPIGLRDATRDAMRTGNTLLMQRQDIDDWIMAALRQGIKDGRITIEEAEQVRDDVFAITMDQQRGLAFPWTPLILVALIFVIGVPLAVWLATMEVSRAKVAVEAGRMTAWQNAYQSWLEAGSPGDSPSVPTGGGGGGGFFDSAGSAAGTVLGGGVGVGVIAAVGVGALLLLGRRR